MREPVDNTVAFSAIIAQRLQSEERESLAGQSAIACSADDGNAVLFASEEFERHTGYSLKEAIGRNLNFLQGPATEPEAVAEFRRLIRTGTAGLVRITNYRKDGTIFVHECEIRPVRDSSDKITHFIAVQRLI